MKRKKKSANIGTIFVILMLLVIGDFFDGSKGENESDYSEKIEETELEYEKPIDYYGKQKNEIPENPVQAEPDTGENGDYSIPPAEEPNKYVNDDILNQLIDDYNEIAEFKLEQWETGAYPFSATMMCNGVYIMAYNSNSIFVDLSIEDWSDSRIYPVFRDFMKTLDNSVADDEISVGWNELLTGKYIGCNYYDIGSVECMCWVKTMNNGAISYTVKTGCKTYK